MDKFKADIEPAFTVTEDELDKTVGHYVILWRKGGPCVAKVESVADGQITYEPVDEPGARYRGCFGFCLPVVTILPTPA